jgi:hypothetical protein
MRLGSRNVEMPRTPPNAALAIPTELEVIPAIRVLSSLAHHHDPFGIIEIRQIEAVCLEFLLDQRQYLTVLYGAVNSRGNEYRVCFCRCVGRVLAREKRGVSLAAA